MAIESNRNSKNVVIGLLFMLALVGYFYWLEAESFSIVLEKVESVTTQLTTANRTVEELTKTNTALKDKVKLLDDEKTKATAATAAEVQKFNTEKNDINAKIKNITDTSKADVDKCLTACDTRVKDARAQCPPQNVVVQGAGAVAA